MNIATSDSLPSFFTDAFTDDDHGWHEFEGLSFTDEDATEKVNFEDWLEGIEEENKDFYN
ncbi:MAG: hypothetical protein KDK36_01385 [Leptospiraceae bacterium]|nr:hypothetical protein [Leptospiraceae bacterium]